MKKYKIIKEIVFYIVVIFFAVISAISFSIYSYAKAYNNYIIEFTQQTKIEDISINGNADILVNFLDKNFYMDGEYLRSYEDGTCLEFSTSCVDNVSIKFDNEDNEVIVYLNNEKENIINGEYNNFISTSEIIKNSIDSKTPIYFIILFPIMLGIIYYFGVFYKKLIDEKIKIYEIIIFSILMFLLYFCVYYTLFLILKRAIIIPIIFLFCYSLYCVFKMKNKYFENIYIAFATIAGITMIYTMVPGNVPDETSHYFKVFKESSFVQQEDDGFYTFPKVLNDFFYKYTHNVQEKTNKIYARNYLSDVFKTANYSNLDTKVSDYRNVKYLSSVPYIPSIIIMAICKIVNSSPLIILLLCRLANYLITLVCCYMAIKHIPRFKRVLLMVCLFPVFIQQAAAINMDWLTNATSILLISYIIFLIYKNEKINYKDTLILVGLCLILSLGKFGYFPILFLIFLIPNEKFKSKKISLLYKILFILLTFVVSFLLNVKLTAGQNFGITDNNIFGLSYLFTNPIESVKIIFKTLFIRIDQDIFRGFIDIFAYSTIFHQYLFSIVIYFIYFLLIFTEDENNEKLTVKQRTIILLIPVMIIGIIYLIAFSQWTNIGRDTIYGIQARYFLPVSPLIYIGLSSNKLKIEVKDKRTFYSLLLMLAILVSFFTIIKFFS